MEDDTVLLNTDLEVMGNSYTLCCNLGNELV